MTDERRAEQAGGDATEPQAIAETSPQPPEVAASKGAAEAAAEASGTSSTPPASAPPDPAVHAQSSALHSAQSSARTKDEVQSLSPFSVAVGAVYDGPLDLLLDLIRKQDIDIYDIPIARITAQFLGYVERLKQTDVDAAGDFIYTAALLIHIKSRMLLPRSPVEAAEGESEDPRRELVERLLEHERFKNAAQMLRQKQQIEEATWSRPAVRDFEDETTGEREIAADTVDLVRVFREVLERIKQRPVLEVDDESVTVGKMIHYLQRRLTMEDAPVALSQMLRTARSERAVICMFLALLELVRLQAILLRQQQSFGDIMVKKHSAFEQVMNDTLAARDDWQ